MGYQITHFDISEDMISESCRVSRKVILSASNKACMSATWLNYSLKKLIQSVVILLFYFLCALIIEINIYLPPGRNV